MAEETSTHGKIHVTPTAIATIASHAVLKSYGVMGMANRNFVADITSALTRDPNHGVRVHIDGNQVTIDVYVVLAYGTRIATVARSLIDAVRFEVERSLGMDVEQVNIYVQGLMLDDDAS